LSNRVLAGSLALLMFGALAGQSGKTQSQAGRSNAAQAAQRELAQQAIPDAPKPQTKLPNLGSIAPGQGTTSTSADTAPAGATPVTPPAGSTPAPATASAPSASGPRSRILWRNDRHRRQPPSLQPRIQIRHPAQKQKDPGFSARAFRENVWALRASSRASSPPPMTPPNLPTGTTVRRCRPCERSSHPTVNCADDVQ